MPKIISLLLLSLVLFPSCKKELRAKTYSLTAYNNSGLTGKVSFKETENKTMTTVRLEAGGLIPNTVYLTHLHTGNLDSLTGTLIYFNNLQTATGSVVREEAWNESFDGAIVSNTCFTIHDPNHFANDYTSYFLGGNTGKNAP